MAPKVRVGGAFVGALVLALIPARAAIASPDCLTSYRDGQQLKSELRLVDARRELVACSQDSCPAVYRRDCVKWLNDVEARLPSLAAIARGEDGCDRVDAKVSMDGGENAPEIQPDGRPVPIDPGPHAVTVTLGEQERQQTVVLAVGEHRVVSVSFAATGAVCGARPAAAADETAPTRPPPPAAIERPTPTTVYVLGGIGLAGLGVGAGFGAAAWTEKGDLDACKAACSDRAVDTMERNFRITDIGIGVASLAAAAAIVYLFAPRAASR